MRDASTEPVSTMTFGRLTIEYDEQVLQPRPWTTMQSGWAVELLTDADDGHDGQEVSVLELCAGAGHIGLLVAAETGCRLVAVDVDPVACGFALRNSERAGLAERVEVRCAGLEEAVGAGERFDLVVADPPWVTTTDVGDYPDDPTLAIDGGADGLDVARACLRVAQRQLGAGGSLLLQLGTSAQCDAVGREASHEHGLVEASRREGERGWVIHLRAAASTTTA